MSRARILVADDDGGTREILKSVLESSGHTVELARDGEEAFGIALDWPPDLLLTDIRMPRLDGWALVKRLRSRAEFALVPVIFLTELSSEEDRIRGFKLGADDYIPKPFDFDEMVARVERALERRKTMEKEILRGLVSADDPTTDADGERDGERDEVLLQGQLTSFGFSALLSVFEHEKATGVLELEHPDGRRGRVWVRDGHVVQASIEDGDRETRGAEAVYALLAWRSGSFVMHRTSVEDEDAVGMSSTHLLLEGARRLDEDEGLS